MSLNLGQKFISFDRDVRGICLQYSLLDGGSPICNPSFRWESIISQSSCLCHLVLLKVHCCLLSSYRLPCFNSYMFQHTLFESILQQTGDLDSFHSLSNRFQGEWIEEFSWHDLPSPSLVFHQCLDLVFRNLMLAFLDFLDCLVLSMLFSCFNFSVAFSSGVILKFSEAQLCEIWRFLPKSLCLTSSFVAKIVPIDSNHSCLRKVRPPHAFLPQLKGISLGFGYSCWTFCVECF